MRKTIVIIALALAFFAGPALADDEILLGTSAPLTGPYATSGEVMVKAYQMAVDEYNAAGGLLGKKLRYITGDIGDMLAENVTGVAERLVSQGCDAIITGYDSFSNANIKVYGRAEMPYMTAPAYRVISDAIAAGLPGTNNCFVYCWDESTYGQGLMNEMFQVPKKIGWTPPNNKVAVLKVDTSYSIIPADLFGKLAVEAGYDLVIDELVQFGKIDFGTFLTKVERQKPAFLFVTLCSPEDAARFQTQFYDRFGKKGIETLIVHQYACSVPDWVNLTGPVASEGVINMYGAVRLHDPKLADYVARWEAKYNEKPFDTYAIHCRDGFEIWAQAVKRAGDAKDYTNVCRLMRESVYEGMFGTYAFSPRNQQALYGEYLLPLEWIQFRDGAPVVVYPDRSANADYEMPPWIKTALANK